MNKKIGGVVEGKLFYSQVTGLQNERRRESPALHMGVKFQSKSATLGRGISRWGEVWDSD